MPITNPIVDYDPEWPLRFREEARRLEPAFGGTGCEIHHVGSTAVPGLAAKPEIDILVVVAGIERSDLWDDPLTHLGYLHGTDFSAEHLFFRRNVNGVRTHKIHVCAEGNREIHRLIRFRDRLRADSLQRDTYGSLKRQLARENTLGMGEYLDGKTSFVEATLAGEVV